MEIMDRRSFVFGYIWNTCSKLAAKQPHEASTQVSETKKFFRATLGGYKQCCFIIQTYWILEWLW
jgi:hypothetical protein